MKNRVIFFDDFNNIEFNKTIRIEKQGYTKYYQKLENEIVEVVCCKERSKLREFTLINNNDKCIFVIKEINESNINLIKDLYADNIILAVGKIELKDDVFKKNCEFLNDICYLPQLVDDNDSINLNFFILCIKRKNILRDNKSKYIFLGEEEGVKAYGNIPIFILKRFERIQNLNKFYLRIYGKCEMNVAEVSYIEDCMREYINDDSVFRIDQIKNNESDKIYFVLYAE